MSLLFRSEILGLFANTLIADDKYSRGNKENIPQPNQIILAKKTVIFCLILIAVWKCIWNLDNIWKKDESYSLSISEITNSKIRGYLNNRKILL